MPLQNPSPTLIATDDRTFSTKELTLATALMCQDGISQAELRGERPDGPRSEVRQVWITVLSEPGVSISDLVSQFIAHQIRIEPNAYEKVRRNLLREIKAVIEASRA